MAASLGPFDYKPAGRLSISKEPTRNHPNGRFNGGFPARSNETPSRFGHKMPEIGRGSPRTGALAAEGAHRANACRLPHRRQAEGKRGPPLLCPFACQASCRQPHSRQGRCIRRAWTPLILSGCDQARGARSGRAGQPDTGRLPIFVLASKKASYMSGQVLHPNGGEVVTGCRAPATSARGPGGRG